MSGTEPSFEELNAYVDGELDAGARARVAQAVAARPDLARQVATLSAMKDAASQTVPVQRQAPPRETKAPRRRIQYAAVAAAALLVALLLTVQFGGWRAETSRPGWLVQAWQIHHDLFEDSGETASAGHILTALSAFPHEAYIPDLTATKLEIGTVRTVQAPVGGSAIAIGYLGTRGCRLALLIFADDAGLMTKPSSLAAEPALASGWRVGRLNYLLLADGMARPRFDLITDSVYRGSIEQTRFDQRTRQALRQSRISSPPCQHG